MDNYVQGTLLPDTFKKSNFLIKAKYYSSSLFENKVLAVGLATVKVSKDNRLEARIHKSQLKKYIGGSRSNFYDRVKSVKKLVYNNVIFAMDPQTRRFKTSALITDVEWGEDDDSELIIIFNETFRNQILDLKDNYTLLSLNGLSKIDTIGAYRLYETLLSSYNYLRSQEKNRSKKEKSVLVSYSVAELRCMMNCVDISHPEFSEYFDQEKKPDYDKIVKFAEVLSKKGIDENGNPVFKSKYPEFRDFNKKCLRPSVEEITEKTSLNVEYSTISGGKGGKVIGIQFIISEKENEAVEVIEEKEIDLDDLLDEVRRLIREDLSTKEIKQIMAAADNDISKISKAYEVAQSQNVENLVGFLISAIKNDYRKPVKSKKKESNSYKFENQGAYDYDELEKAIINK